MGRAFLGRENRCPQTAGSHASNEAQVGFDVYGRSSHPRHTSPSASEARSANWSSCTNSFICSLPIMAGSSRASCWHTCRIGRNERGGSGRSEHVSLHEIKRRMG